MAIDKDVEGRALFSFKDQVLVQVPYINDDEIETIMSAYQKPQKAQAETSIEVVKAPKEPIIHEEIIKSSRKRQLCNQPRTETHTQSAKLRLVQPHSENTNIHKSAKE